MAMHLVFWKLEWKRACRRLPQVLAGAAVLVFLAVSVVFLAGNLLYGETASGRITVGVVMPQEDLLAEKVIEMIESLDSVNSMCDFLYLEQEDAEEKLENGELFAVMEIPEQMVEGIMDGTNPPVRVLVPGQSGVETKIFQELTEAGAAILGSAQAGIYAGGELCRSYGVEAAIPQMEQELNRIFLGYSLPREDYFRYVQVSATGDLDPFTFYGVSAYVLFLLLSAIPASAYLLPWNRVMKQKLRMAGIGSVERTAARAAGLGSLYLAVTAAAAAGAAGAAGLMGSFLLAGGSSGLTGSFLQAGGSSGLTGQSGRMGQLIRGILPSGALELLLLIAAAALVCLAAAVLTVFLYQVAGTLFGGVILLFLVATVQHFLAGGFLPLVFLPSSVRSLAPVLPSSVLMDGVGMIVTGAYEAAVFGKLCLMIVAGLCAGALLERREA